MSDQKPQNKGKPSENKSYLVLAKEALEKKDFKAAKDNAELGFKDLFRKKDYTGAINVCIEFKLSNDQIISTATIFEFLKIYRHPQYFLPQKVILLQAP